MLTVSLTKIDKYPISILYITLNYIGFIICLFFRSYLSKKEWFTVLLHLNFIVTFAKNN